MKIASIDIGTNTVLLLITEVQNEKFKIIKDEYRIPRIGKSLTMNRTISDDSLYQLIQVLNDYLIMCKKENVDRIICGGTAPFRIALNTNEIIEKVFLETGLKINVLLPNEEAILTFLGGISNFEEFYNKTNFVVIDVGGGSTELVFGNINKIYFYKSYNVGAVTLKDRFFSDFPYKFNFEFVQKHLNQILDDEINFRNFITIAVDGTPMTIASILLKHLNNHSKFADKFLIKINMLIDLIYDFYIKSPTKILEAYPSIVKGREDVILPGTIILYSFLKKINSKGFYASNRGVRFGLIIKELMFQRDGFWTKVGLKKLISSLNG